MELWWQPCSSSGSSYKHLPLIQYAHNNALTPYTSRAPSWISIHLNDVQYQGAQPLLKPWVTEKLSILFQVTNMVSNIQIDKKQERQKTQFSESVHLEVHLDILGYGYDSSHLQGNEYLEQRLLTKSIVCLNQELEIIGFPSPNPIHLCVIPL